MMYQYNIHIIILNDIVSILTFSKNYGVKITPKHLIEDYTMHFTPICIVISTPSVVFLTLWLLF